MSESVAPLTLALATWLRPTAESVDEIVVDERVLPIFDSFPVRIEVITRFIKFLTLCPSSEISELETAVKRSAVLADMLCLEELLPPSASPVESDPAIQHIRHRFPDAFGKQIPKLSLRGYGETE